MYQSLTNKLGFVYSFNMIFIFIIIFAAIIIDGFQFGLVSASLVTFAFMGFGGWLIYRLDRCQQSFESETQGM